MNVKQTIIGLGFWFLAYAIPAYFTTWWIGLMVMIVPFCLIGLIFSASLGKFGAKMFKMISPKYEMGEIEFYKNSIMVAHIETSGAGFAKINGEFIIVVDKHFFKMSKETQLFLLNHEMSHKTDTYVATIESRRDLVLKNLILDNEAKADLYAASIIGCDVALKGLQELAALYPSDSLAKKEFDLRINYLQNNCI